MAEPQQPWRAKEREIRDVVRKLKTAAAIREVQFNEDWIRHKSFEEVVGTLLLNGISFDVILDS